jgi:hypothetical protein
VATWRDALQETRGDVRILLALVAEVRSPLVVRGAIIHLKQARMAFAHLEDA